MNGDLSVDQQLALTTAASRLRDRFAGVFAVETTERFVYHSHDEFSGRAAVPQGLPLLAERFALQRQGDRPGAGGGLAALDLIEVRAVRDDTERRVRQLIADVVPVAL